MIGIETDRLIFRKWNHSDFTSIKEFYQDKISSRFVGGIKDAEEAWRILCTYLGQYELLGYSYLAMVEKETGSFVGGMGIWNSEPWPEPELGYWILPRAQGKGFATEGGKAVKKFALETLELVTLVSYIDSDNLPSKNVAQKLDGKYDGDIELLDFGLHQVFRYK